VLFDQKRIFEQGTVGAHLRLLSHLVVSGPLVAGVALVLYLHVLGDAYADNRARGNLPWQAGPPELAAVTEAGSGPQ